MREKREKLCIQVGGAHGSRFSPIEVELEDSRH
jgi:hypothetical protein